MDSHRWKIDGDAWNLNPGEHYVGHVDKLLVELINGCIEEFWKSVRIRFELSLRKPDSPGLPGVFRATFSVLVLIVFRMYGWLVEYVWFCFLTLEQYRKNFLMWCRTSDSRWELHLSTGSKLPVVSDSFPQDLSLLKIREKLNLLEPKRIELPADGSVADGSLEFLFTAKTRLGAVSVNKASWKQRINGKLKAISPKSNDKHDATSLSRFSTRRHSSSCFCLALFFNPVRRTFRSQKVSLSLADLKVGQLLRRPLPLT